MSKFRDSLKNEIPRILLKSIRQDKKFFFHHCILGFVLSLLLSKFGDYSLDQARAAYDQLSLPTLLFCLVIGVIFCIIYYIRPKKILFLHVQERIYELVIFLLDTVRGAVFILVGSTIYFCSVKTFVFSIIIIYFQLITAEFLTKTSKDWKNVYLMRPYIFTGEEFLKQVDVTIEEQKD